MRPGGISPNEDRYGQGIMPHGDETSLADAMPDPVTGRYDPLPLPVDISFQDVPPGDASFVVAQGAGPGFGPLALSGRKLVYSAL